jgi:hypothetical protein
MERSTYENTVTAELSRLPADATLAPHDLPEDRLAIVRAMVAGNAKHIRRAYLLRRILTSDPACHDYVICIETARFTLGNKGPAVIKRLAALEWPMHVFIVHLGGNRSSVSARRSTSRRSRPFTKLEATDRPPAEARRCGPRPLPARRPARGHARRGSRVPTDRPRALASGRTPGPSIRAPPLGLGETRDVADCRFI